jgi:two-component system, NtrC family, sensor kinase
MMAYQPAEIAEMVNAAKLASLGMLVAGVAHELNTPLGALHSNHDVLLRALNRLDAILEDDVVDEHELDEVRRVVRAVRSVVEVDSMAVERMVQLVRSMRNFGRLDRAVRDTMDVHEGIDSALALLSHELSSRITVERDYGALPQITCYPQQLNQVFMNLLLNACQAISGPGTITIRTALAAADRVVIEISDTGAGIAEEDRARIFEPGFTTKGKRVGMGLGLLIVREILDQHSGVVEVESVVGAGTTFRILLPVAGGGA